ncbi:tRNA pseudouridine(55) synthase TruB [Lachnoclostridium sp. Marseille-P6806]|uniref:tRNA pseudouridine(55) synthase TruB n=1 Tax=Lachnoclostridium sp. Marseille-P6806 TaxID=2364793 RepID=UPI001031F1B8|nr:tRNA pseudouridine(55) synthase TruB [Lachnoclostridium sp. Marseille-P6806]
MADRIQSNYNGMLTVRKEAGYTSNDVVAKLRGILHMRKIGHGGTLDPDAEGVLPVCLGNGTRLVDLIAERDKEYVALLRLGIATDTQDLSAGAVILSECSGERIRESVTPERLAAVCRSFVGEYDQIPPMYSALKQNGRRLYELAREGKTVPRAPRRVRIHALLVENVELPCVTLRVQCSKGTYIRTLCDDIGTKLGVGGAMEHLLRTRVGGFFLEDALTLDGIRELQEEGRLCEHILPPDSFFASAPPLHVLPEHDFRLRNGNVMEPGQTDGDGAALRALRASAQGEEDVRVRMYFSDGRFAGLYSFDGQRLRPEKMFLPD